MELKFLILSVACFSCLVPQALSAAIFAKTAAASALAAKGAVIKGLIGAKIAAAGKGLALAKGALALKGAAIGKGIALARGAAITASAIADKAALAAGAVQGALAMKGALIARSALAAKGLIAAKKGLAAKGLMLAKGVAAKGLMLAKGAAAAAVAKGAAAIAAKAKGAALLAAKGALAKGAKAVGGLALGKFGGLSKGVVVKDEPVAVSYAQPLVVPALRAFGPVPFGRRALMLDQLFYQAAERPAVLGPVAEAAGIVGRIAGWAGAIQDALATQSNTAAELVEALTRRVASGSSPVVFQMAQTQPRFYPAPIMEKVETAY